MLDGPNTETSEVRYTRGIQINAQLEKPAPNRPLAGPRQWEKWTKMMAQKAWK